MTLYVGTSQFVNQYGAVVPQMDQASRPANPIVGQVIYNTTTSKLETWKNNEWREVLDNNRPYLYRTIITTGYVVGGYKDSSPWKNANKMNHSTDVMTNLGNLLSVSAGYVSGANNKTTGFVWGASDSHPGSSTTTVAINMSTDTGAGTNSNWNSRVSRGDAATVFKETEYAYISGGGNSTVDVFNLTNETMFKDVTGQAAFSGEGSGFSDETAGYMWDDSSGYKFVFSNSSTYGVPTYGVHSTVVRAAHSQQKGINSKVRMGWCGNEGTYNGGYNLRRYSFNTDTSLGTVAKPIGNTGEENFDMGQAWQYMHGCYDGAQNNRSWKFNYSTETGSELGSGSQRTGIPGSSSGHCFWKG